jgi:PilZ domain
MNSYYRSLEAFTSSVAEDERRYNDRSRFQVPVVIRHIDGSGIEHAGLTQDLSRDGLYLAVRARGYSVGMQLRLTMPETQSEWICEVVRVEDLPNGGQGIAVTRV